MDRNSDDEQIFESVGKCHVKIRRGMVVEIVELRIKGCILAKRFEIPVN